MQTQGRCPEDFTLDAASCLSDDDCPEGEYPRFGHGPMTGRCVVSDRDLAKQVRVCEIHSWCPVEDDRYKDKKILQL